VVKTFSDAGYPAAALVDQGLRDLDGQVESSEALLVSIGAPRLRRLGIQVEHPILEPEERLYRLLQDRYGDAAHSRYNSLIRSLVSFERAAALEPHA
jgi:hypothetical protein